MTESRILGDYTLLKQIGQGALGTVYLAEHRFMKKQFALKILPEEFSQDRSFIQRFEEDIRLLVTLDHPNIVKIHNISYSEGRYFLVIDCIVDAVGETTNLAQYLQSRTSPLREEETFQILAQVADALDYAHTNTKMGPNGVVHRGLKLNNVLVSQGDRGIQVYLSDYGLTRIIGTGLVLSRTYKVVADELRAPSEVTESQKQSSMHQSLLQNFAFLAPEQKKTELLDQVDKRADIYAFGVLTYYLLMHEYPEGYFEMPSKRHSHLKWQWDQIIAACMAKDPKARPDHLRSALEAIKDQPKEGGENAHPKATTFQTEAAPQKEKVLIPVTSTSDGSLKPIIRSAKLERPEYDPDPARVFQVDTTVKHYTPEKKEIKNVEPILTEMVVIEGGKFSRGSNDGNRDEMPRHPIFLNSCAIDIHPTTNEQFVRFLDAMGGEKDRNNNDIIRLRDSRIKRSAGKLIIESGYLKHPVVGVTWYGALAYADWVGKRLPTEAEWEIAACSGDEGNFYPTGDDVEKTQANFFSSDTTNVMSYSPNACGLYDMAGNVYEWCHDWYGYNYYETSMQEPDNPKGPLQGVYRVLRGGCWKSLKEDLRCSRRHRNNPGTVNSTYGFRCATDVTA